MDEVKSLKAELCLAQLEAANAENVRLTEENALMRQQLEKLTAEKHSNGTVHIEAKLNAFRFEDERDRMYEKLENTKRKYNQLHEAYLEKVKRCKALEEVFRRQKTLNGLVAKAATNQQRKEPATEEPQSTQSYEAQLAKLQAALDEAYDVIDELEFELESVDFLEVENQRLRNELQTYKKDNCNLSRAATSSHPMEHGTVGSGYDELPAYRQRNEGSSRHEIDSNVSSLAESIVGEWDAATIERSVLTESLIRTVEIESNCLRRELLRSRLQKTVRPTSSDA